MFLNKFLKKEIPSIHPPAGLITDITDLDEFKQRLGIKSRAKTLWRPIKYLAPLPEQSRNAAKTVCSNSGKIRTVGIYDSFPTYEDTRELFEQFGGGKDTILSISPRRMKVGYYEFEGEDRFPEEEEAPKDSSSNTNPGTSRKPSSSKDWKKGMSSSSARSRMQNSPARVFCEKMAKCRLFSSREWT